MKLFAHFALSARVAVCYDRVEKSTNESILINPFVFVYCMIAGHKFRDTRDARSRWTCSRCGHSTRRFPG